MPLVTWNPVALVKKGLEKGLNALTEVSNDPTPPSIPNPNTKPTPVTQPLTPTSGQPDSPASSNLPTVIDQNGQALETEQVSSGVWIDASQMMHGAAAARTEQFSRIVSSFDEDRQDKLAWLVGKFFTVLAYLLPPLLGWYAGLALGDVLSGPFTFARASSVFLHLVSVSLELAVPMIGYAVASTFKRAAKDRAQITKCATLLLVFLGVAVGSAISQQVLLYNSLPMATFGQQVSVWFRSFGPSVVDMLSAIFLSVVGVKNLKKYLADQREKIHAVREVSLVHIEMDKTSLQAAIDQQSALQDMKSKSKRADTWNKIEEMQSEAMIEQARRNMGGDNGGSGYRRSRY